ncbi:MAG: sulfatase-like hydrolase/transferase [Thermoanaerobaculia bacterium]
MSFRFPASVSRAILTSTTAATLWVCGACGPPADAPILAPNPAARNAILVVFDTLRADHMSVYGYAKETTPYLDSRADEMIRWVALKAPESWTLPTHASLFTGRWPAQHHVSWAHKSLDPRLVTVAEVLEQAGFCTVGLSSNPMIRKKTGFEQGFQSFRNFPTPHETKTDRLLAVVPEVLDEAAERGCRLFPFINLMDAHTPVSPHGHDREFGVDGPGPITTPQQKWEANAGIRPLSAEERRLNAAAYDAGVRSLDDAARTLLSLLSDRGLLDQSVVAFTADHGEGLDRELGHVLSAWEEQLAIPLLVRFPQGESGGTVVDTPESAVGLGPTLLDWLGVPRPPEMEDVPPLGDTAIAVTPAADHRSYFDEAFEKNQRMRELYPELAAATPHVHIVYCAPYKLFVRSDETVSLFDLRKDPGERRDVAAERPEILRQCVGRYRELLAAGRLMPFDVRPEGDGDETIDDETLRSLGYLQ